MIRNIFRFVARLFLLRMAFHLINRLFGNHPQTTRRYNRSNMA